MQADVLEGEDLSTPPKGGMLAKEKVENWDTCDAVFPPEPTPIQPDEI
jgi:hypothetical protein